MQLKKLLAFAGLSSLATAQNASLAQVLSNNTQLSNLTSLLQQQPALLATLSNLSNITVLAPNNAAISALLADNATVAAIGADPNLLTAVLSYHVLNGSYANFSSNTTFVRTALMNTPYTSVVGGQRVEIAGNTTFSGLMANSTIVGMAQFSGGYVYIIDKVLTLPQSVSATATAFNLTSFYGAINATNLLNTVNGLANSTFFVPNNAAFRAIGSALPSLSTAQITSILGYHVVNGTVGYSTSLMNGTTLRSLSGGNLTVTISNGSVFVNSARVVIPNLLVANGVVHVIDEVLNPNNTAIANSTATAGAPAYSGVSSGTVDPYTTGQPTPTSSINTGAIASSATARATSSSSGGAWAPKATGAIGAAALGGLALLMQL